MLAVTKTLKVTPEPDSTYILKGGTKYTIKAKYPNGKFTVEQDNWVYAPNGGKWTAGPNKYSLVMEQMYISRDLLVAMVEEKSKGDATVNLNKPIEEQVSRIMKEFDIDDSNTALKESMVSLFFSLKGGLETIAALANPGIFIIVDAVATDIVNVYFMKKDFSTILDYINAKDFKDACQTGNLNIIATKTNHEYPTWHSWITNGYINKFYRSGDNFWLRGTVSLGLSSQDIIDYCGF